MVTAVKNSSDDNNDDFVWFRTRGTAVGVKEDESEKVDLMDVTDEDDLTHLRTRREKRFNLL